MPDTPTAAAVNAMWNTFSCDNNVLYQWQNGPLKIWLKRTANDWLLASDTFIEEDAQTGWSQLLEEPAGLEWKRWPFNDMFDQVALIPVMPDRPLVVKTRIESNLPPGVKAMFYVHISLHVKVSAVLKNRMVEMIRLPTITLSNTWFGDNFGGELCYALKTRAVRDQRDATFAPYRAVCPVLIHNDSDTALPIQKICIRAKHLNIYQTPERLWTNQVNVTFRGEGLTSRVDYKTTLPVEIQDARLLQEAEEKPQNNIISTLGHGFLNIF